MPTVRFSVKYTIMIVWSQQAYGSVM